MQTFAPGFQELAPSETTAVIGGDAGAITLGLAIAATAWAAFEIGRTKLGPWLCDRIFTGHDHVGDR